MSQNGLLKMKELAEASGVSAGTIKHYLREGLLGDGEAVVKTSRNMAYYPPEFVERIRLIKQLQEERFMPLAVIRSMLDEDPERAQALVELEDRILERALAGERKRVSAAELRRRYDTPQEVLDRLAELEVVTPTSRGYGQRDVEIVEAISRFRAGGYDERIGFTVYDTLRYKRALEELVKEEVQVLMDRLAGESKRVSAAELRRRYEIPQEVLDRLAELEVLTPTSRGFGQPDVEIVEAISRFRAGGYDERIGFTVYDTLRYKRALEELVKEEVQVLMDRLAGEVEPDRAVELIAAGSEPLNDLIAALHQKSLVAELRRQRAARNP